MIEGIQILKKEEIYKESPETIILVLIIGVALLVIGLVLLRQNVDSKLGLRLSFLGGVLIVMSPMFVKNVPSGKYEYTATIDKGVDLVTFNAAYEIVRQEDKLYIIREKQEIK